MRPVVAQWYGLGWMAMGYAAGLRKNGSDWTGIPWWGDGLIGVAMFAISWALHRSDRRRQEPTT